MTGRNVFENNEPSRSVEMEEADLDFVKNGPHVVLPPLAEGYEYALTDLPSGHKAVVVVDPNVQECTCGPDEKCSLCPPLKHDRFGRKYTQ